MNIIFNELRLFDTRYFLLRVIFIANFSAIVIGTIL